MLELASKYGLEPTFKKCQFLHRKVQFLGHEIENGRIRPIEENILAIKKIPALTSVKQVQSFLGLSGYFRKYVPSYSRIAKPLSDLLKSGSTFVFGVEQEQ